MHHNIVNRSKDFCSIQRLNPPWKERFKRKTLVASQTFACRRHCTLAEQTLYKTTFSGRTILFSFT